MDKRTILAFLLIGAILIFTQTDWYKETVIGVKQLPKAARIDSSKVLTQKEFEQGNTPKAILKNDEPKKEIIQNYIDDKSNALTSELDAGVGKDIIIKTNKYNAIFSTKGATVKSWILNDYYYSKEDDIFVQLIKNNGYGNLGINFVTENDTIQTSDFIFISDKNNVDLTYGDSTQTVIFELKLTDTQILRKTFTFYDNTYLFDLDVELVNLGNLISDQRFTLVWLSGLHHTEVDIEKDMENAQAYIYFGGDKEELKLSNKPNQYKKIDNIEGTIDWVAIRTKYFASIIFPDSAAYISAKLEGKTERFSKKDIIKTFSTNLQVKIPESRENNIQKQFQIYLGPLDYDIIKNYHSGLDKILGFGPAIFRPFAKLTIKVFNFLHSFIPNYGFVLIVFSILVKLVVYPLTRKSYVAMKEMQNLQPLMSEMKEKYKKDPKKMQSETMKLYKEHGVNPISGCLPNLLQMPLLIAIFYVFRNTIQLRQEPFIWWIKDLSSPDTILLPFSLPLIGNALHIIPLFMGATMFFQQKMTMKDPKQKAMVYMMPIFLTFIFYKFPSGLNLYYTLFNVFSIIQQKLVSDKPGTGDIAAIKTPDKKKKK